MNAYMKTYYILFVTASLLLSFALPVSASSITLGSSDVPSYEKDADNNAAAMIANWSSIAGYTTYNWYGNLTDAIHIFNAANGCGYPNSISFYIGHGDNWSLTGHWAIIDNDGNLVYDKDIFPHSASKNVNFVLLWSCLAGDTRGGNDSNGSPYGMPHAWLHTNSSSSDGYSQADNGSFAFVGFQGAAPYLTYNFSEYWGLEEGYHFLLNFYQAALIGGHTFSINDALDHAAFAVWGFSSPTFLCCTLHTGYTIRNGGDSGAMIVYGNGNIHISDYEPPPVCAMKTERDGFFYIPKVVNTGSSRLKIEMLFTDSNLVGDQTGNQTHPYPGTITDYPDGKVNILDVSFVVKEFGSDENQSNWHYMADVVPDRKINILDVSAVTKNYGKPSGSYIYGLSGVTVTFDTSFPMLPANGFVSIPPDALNFTIQQDGNQIGAMVTFWTP